MAKADERFWDDLLLYIEERKVIPVVGSDVTTVRVDGAEVTLQRWLAQGLGRRMGADASRLPADYSLNDMVALCLRERLAERDDLYARLLQLLREAPREAGRGLQALASIEPLRLFVSLTFDGLLPAALAAARPNAQVQTIAYAVNSVRDLPDSAGELRQPTVFQLLGQASSTPDYAICDDDLLEILHGLQDGARRPVRLFDALRSSHLLLIGCGFPDWLARFFLRTARGQELALRRKRWDVFADERSATDATLATFLASYSADSRIVDLPAAGFVEELARRWHATHPPAASQQAGALTPAAARAGPVAGAVFVSYASEDRAAAERLARDLEAKRLDVWFDHDELQAGDDWDRSIARGVERCALFVPVISRTSVSESSWRRYFWREWNAADKLAAGRAPDDVFVVPVVTDDTRIDAERLPASFLRRQAVQSAAGGLTPAQGERFVELVRDFHRRTGAAR